VAGCLLLGPLHLTSTLSIVWKKGAQLARWVVARDQGLVLATLALLGVAVYVAVGLHRSSQVEVERQFKTVQQLLAQQVAQEMASYLQTCGGDLRSLARQPSVQALQVPQIQSDVGNYLRAAEAPAPRLIEVTDRDGKVVYSSGGRAGAVTYAGSEPLLWASRRDSRNKVFIWPATPVLNEPPRTNARCDVLLATPISYTNARPATTTAARRWNGMLVAAVDLAPVVRRISDSSSLAASERVWIMDQSGTVLLQSEHPEMTRANIHRTDAGCAECHGSFDYAEQMLSRRKGVTEYQLKHRPKKMAAYFPMQSGDVSWLVVVNAPATQVAAFAWRSSARTFCLLGIIAATIGLASFVAHRANLRRVQAEGETRRWQEQLRLEGELLKAEVRYRTLFEQSPDGIVMLDASTTLPLVFNEAAHKRLGYSREEFSRLRLADYEAGESAEGEPGRLAQLAREGRSCFETRHRTKAGEVRNVEVIAQTLELGPAKVLHCIYHDITARKHAEEALARRSAQLEALHTVGLSITAELERSVLLETITQQALNLFQGTSGALFLRQGGQETLELVVRAGAASAPLGSRCHKGEGLAGQVWQSGRPQVMANCHNCAGASTGPCVASVGAPICWGESFVGVMEICSDVPGYFSANDADLLGLFATQAAIALKNAGLLEQVRQDAAVKTTLLHDVNHRVKNNLLRLVEVVRLERSEPRKPGGELDRVLGDLESRLLGMAVVHSMLSNAQWRPLLLSELVQEIVTSALSGSPIRQQIQATVTVPPTPVWVVAEQATALALILNELATNSVKHAFGERREGNLSVCVEVDEPSTGRPQVRLVYQDDGPGWPETILQGAHGRVGLRLIRASVRSPLRGQIALSNDEGAVAHLTFRLASVAEPLPKNLEQN
jgi:PAS domain S-box-containing protein